MTDMQDLLAKLDPKTRKRVQLAQSVVVNKQLTPSVGLNIALNGGLAYGRQHLVFGNKSAGKTSFCLMLIAQAQREGKLAAWIDCEMTFDPDWAAKLGVDLEKLLIVQEIGINQVTEAAVELVKAGADILVIDSISDILSSAFWTDKNELKDFENTGQIGSQAKDLGRMSNMIMAVNSDCMVVMISQVTAEIQNYGKLGFHGGNKTKHNSSTIIKVFSSEAQAEQIKDKIRVGDALIETVVGRPVNWTVVFNKTAAMGATGQYNFYFAGPYKPGINRESELAKLGTLYGLVKKSGAWYTVEGQVLQGESKVIEYLTENPDIASVLEERIYELARGNIEPLIGADGDEAQGEEEVGDNVSV